MKTGRVNRKVMLGTLAAVIMAAAVVSAAVILSAEVARDQNVFGALELTVSPDPFPDLIVGVSSTSQLDVVINVTNPAANPTVTGASVTISLVSDGCLTGTASESTTLADLCVAPVTLLLDPTGDPLVPGASIELTVTILYSAGFVGVASWTFQAEGTSV